MADSIPPSLQRCLEELRDYMHRFYPQRVNADPFPLEFWRLQDDDDFAETLSYLPLFMGKAVENDFALLPDAFRLAYPIFWIEDDYHVNGWTALSNAGERLLPSAIAAYLVIGMESEAKALDAALQAYRADPENEEAIEAAYKSVSNAFADEDAKYEALLAFFRTNAHLWEQRSLDQ